MKIKQQLLCFFVAAFILGGCYSSRASGTHDDAGPDSIDVREDDVRADDAAPDTGPDTVDAPPDTTPPAPYALHEWGVISIGDFGSIVHGPSPTSTDTDMFAEKPVIYLYCEEEISPLSIGVDFASGAAEKVWPPVAPGPRIEWKNLAVRPGACETTPFPYSWDDPLCEICNLGSCVVEGASCIDFMPEEGLPHTSKLLFYAGGVGNYRPVLSASAYFGCNDLIASPCISFDIRNDSPFNIDGAWLIYRETTDACLEPYMACPPVSADIAFTYIDGISTGDQVLRQMTIGHYEAEVDEYGFPISDIPLPEEWLDLGKDLLVKLTEKGLTEEEAAAFLRNWDRVFFGIMGCDSWTIEPLYSNGAFIIYFMNPDEYDLQFPLTAQPPPRETVRVGMIFQKLDLHYDL